MRALATPPDAVIFARVNAASVSLTVARTLIAPESVVPVLVVLESVRVGAIVSIRRFDIRDPVCVDHEAPRPETLTDPDPWVASVVSAGDLRRY